jgi:hypothetical protein
VASDSKSETPKTTSIPAASAIEQDCPTCGQPTRGAQTAQRSSSVARQPIYAIGRLHPKILSRSVQEEFNQAREGDPSGKPLTISELKGILEQPDYYYLGRHVCWTVSVQGFEVVAIRPREDADVKRFAESLEDPDDPDDTVHVVVGRTIPEDMSTDDCRSLGLPMVEADFVLAFNLGELTSGINRHAEAAEQIQENVVRDVFFRLTRRSGNFGIDEVSRALNFAACRYFGIYKMVARVQGEGGMLIGIETRRTHMADRHLVAIRLSFRRSRSEVTERWECLIDVTEMFPFLVRDLAQSYD